MNKKFILMIIFAMTSILCIKSVEAKQYKVAILIYQDVFLMDFCGPLEIFNDASKEDTPLFEVFTVSPENKSIKSHTNTEITANYTIDNCPMPDILVIPGGNLNLASENKKLADWIKNTSFKSKITMSVCTGAFILADLGMLDNLEATTWYGANERLQKKFPKIKVVSGKRYTDNGKIITTAGVSGGVDGALHVVETLFGKETAQKTAKFIEWK